MIKILIVGQNAVSYTHLDVYKRQDISLLEQLADRKEIDGIEVWHPSNEESLVAQLMTLAETHHLLMTGGTDFHGMYSKVPRTIGSYITPQDQVRALEKWKQKRKS